MAIGTEFCLLGPLLVRCGGTLVPVQQGKQRVVLAALLLSANRVVSFDELIETLWGASPPPSARATLRNHVKRLRDALGDADRARIATQPGGYLISVAASELDLSRFESLLGSARAAAQDRSWDRAAGQARAALALWRGEPLVGVESQLLAARELARLTEMWLQAVETRIDADLHLGRHGEVIGELRRLAASYPLRERLHGLLMLALYRDGRQGEALAAYRHARSVLIEELGTEPGTGLRELHQQLLTADPILDVPGPGPAVAGGPGPEVPQQLPASVAHFAGREEELAALTALLDQASAGTPGTVVISAIGGTAGVGKTALAVHWAHQVGDRFPGGQLYVNLRGYDPGQPMTVGDALAGFLRALGVPGPDIPAEEDERAARYRSLLAGRRLLVVADNAGSVEQVRPLLPGSPACVLVVTSRDSLAGLVARHGATRLELGLLPLRDAVGLLRSLIGVRVDADPEAAEALALQCARLPLALRVAAELAAARPATPLADLAGELADQQRRLDLLEAGGDRRTAVRAVFSWSYRHLDPDAARAFRLAGLHPGPDLEPYATAALSATILERATRLLEELARTHLVQPAGPGRYGMHDLLRAYAAGQAAARDSAAERREALTRLFDHYLHTAAAAMDTLFPAEHHLRPRVSPPATPTPPLASPGTARAWLDTQLASLAAVAVHAATCGWLSHATRLAAILFRYLDTGGHYPEAITIHTHALLAAQHARDRAAEATALTSLGVVDRRQGRYQQATGHLRQALALFRETGDKPGQARALSNLGFVDYQIGRYQQSADLHQQALALFREIGDRSGEARQLHNLGTIDERLGCWQQAASHLRQALALSRQNSDRSVEAHVLSNLGSVGLRQGRYQQAAGHLRQALALFRETGGRTGEAHVLADLGDVGLRQGRYQQAAGHLQEALALFRETGDRSGEARTLNGLGEVLLATGRPEHAHARHTAALALAEQIGDKYHQARAHNGLAHARYTAGDPGQAYHHWQQALTLYTEIGTPEAEQVRDQLARNGDHGQSRAVASNMSQDGPGPNAT
jgi:DNA-binding SARP family transcriptional activator/tetratricopeptide (TPR) repeat protein